MKAVHFRGKGAISIDEMERPKAKGRDVVVQIKAAAICGTDRENLEHGGQPYVPGHESAGVAVEVDAPGWIRPGMRVAINCHVTCRQCRHCLSGDVYFCRELKAIGFDLNGGFAEYALIPEECCMALPDDISFETGALMVDNLGTSYKAIKHSGLLPGDPIAIWGAGPVGLAELMLAKHLGLAAAIVDPNPYRLQLAQQLHPDLIICPTTQDTAAELLAWTHGEGIKAGFDCVGHQRIAEECFRALRPKGELVVVGVSRELRIDPWDHLICKEIHIRGTRNFNCNEYGEMISLVRHGLPIDRVITHRFSFEQLREAFETFREGACGKVVIVAE